MTAASIPFVEPKEPDWNNIMKLAAPAIQARRWANFGPISEGLAAEVAKVAGLPESRVAVPASSGTTALHAVVGMHEILAERPLIWIVSAFGFLATVIGPLADRVRVIDCDRTGMLDLDQVAALAPDSWDGLLVTDLFGFNLGISRYQAFCEAAGKLLVIDSATSFPGTWGSTRRASEVISFHHTKPWGFGEGGCAIVDRAHADLVRTLLSHGKGLAAFSRFATNGKMSDVAAIVILDRLLRMPDWSPAYHQQRDRMLSLAVTAEIDCLGRPAQAVISPHVPLLAPHPIAAEGMPRTRFKLEKYYRPLSAYCPVATDIHSRIVNVPCHPMMAEVADTEILACLDDIRARMRA